MYDGHYQICYRSHKFGVRARLRQIYISKIPTDVEPENSSSYSNNVVDAKVKYTVKGGD
jgi:hypothetical protein